MRRPVRDHEYATGFTWPRKPAVVAVRAAGVMTRPAVAVRRFARSVAVEAAVFVLVSAAIATVAHHAALQLQVPQHPAAVCGSSILNGPSSAPGGAVTVAAGDNSAVNFTTPGATYWFAAGTHTLGSSQFSQIDPGDGATFEGAPGAVIDGQGLNQFAFAGSSSNVTIEYLTIQDFIPPGAQGAVNINGEPGWTTEYSTLQDNLPGAAMMLGTGSVVTSDCLTENGEYGFNAYTVNDTSALTGGPSDITVTGNEISHNDTCNWEDDATFPITPPAGCTGAGQFVGCGCSGGGKFWAADTGTIDGNWIHDNYSVGVWWDTNNTGWQADSNYISGNYADGIIYEISYNAQFNSNIFVDNAWGVGPSNPGFPSSAVYISESGSDSRVPGPYGTQFQVDGNQFYDNWGGVVLWENANRYCSSIANTSTGYCTLVNRQAPSVNTARPQRPSHPSSRRGQPGPGRAYGIPQAGWPGVNLQTCSEQQYLGVSPWNSDCRWKTQNVQVSGNLFDFTPANIGGACTAVNFCGFNGVFSEYGTFPPYTGTVVENNITYNQANLFSANTYCGPWQFDALEQGNQYNYATWQAAPYGQDPGSTMNGPACTTAPPLTPARPGSNRPVTVPIFAGRR